ncbi:hypothetical protein G9A89_017770 [Geosiphon pyriformis]|nr:hypothetical protein G9A89_017770 [Geosiphon pyriformis]
MVKGKSSSKQNGKNQNKIDKNKSTEKKGKSVKSNKASSPNTSLSHSQKMENAKQLSSDDSTSEEEKTQKGGKHTDKPETLKLKNNGNSDKASDSDSEIKVEKSVKTSRSIIKKQKVVEKVVPVAEANPEVSEEETDSDSELVTKHKQDVSNKLAEKDSSSDDTDEKKNVSHSLSKILKVADNDKNTDSSSSNSSNSSDKDEDQTETLKRKSSSNSSSSEESSDESDKESQNKISKTQNEFEVKKSKTDNSSESSSEASSSTAESSSDDNSDSEGEGDTTAKSKKQDLANKRKAPNENSSPAKKIKPNGKSKQIATVFVGNLSYNTDQEKLRQEFAEAGEILDVRIVTNRDNGTSKGFGYIDFANAEGANAAVQLSGKEVDGRRVKIEISEPSTRSNNKDDQNSTFSPKQNLSPVTDTLFLGNLSFDVSENHIAELFGEYGSIVSIRLPKFPDTQRPRGFGYIQFADTEAAQMAIKSNGQDFMGRNIRLDFAGGRDSTNRAGNFGGSGNSGSFTGRGGGRGSNRGGRGTGGRGGGGGFNRGRGRGNFGGNSPSASSRGFIVPGKGNKIKFDD